MEKAKSLLSAPTAEPLRRLTNDPAHDTIPAWSADGSSIYFTSDRSGDYQIWKMPAAAARPGKSRRQGALEASESWDGKTLFYSKARGVFGLWRPDPKGGEEDAGPRTLGSRYWRSWSVTPRASAMLARASSPPYRIKFYILPTAKPRNSRHGKAQLWTIPV